MTNEERAEKLFCIGEHINKMRSALYGQRVMWVVAKKREDESWMEHIELFAETLKEKIIEAEREYKRSRNCRIKISFRFLILPCT